MLQDSGLALVTQGLTKDRRRLLDDGGEGDHVDDTLHAVSQGMVQREGKRGQSLAAAGRHGERKEARWLRRPGTRARQNLGAQTIDRTFGFAETREMRIEPRLQFRQSRTRVAKRYPPLTLRIETFRLQEVGVDQAGKEHADQELDLEHGLGFEGHR